MYAIGKVDIGKKRSRNEDSIFISNEGIGTLPNLFIVADGMGGHKAGGVASKLAIEAFCNYIRSHATIDIRTREDVTILLKLAVRHANDVVFQLSKTEEIYMGMGTTFTAATVIQGILYLVHVGDTRLYMLNENEIIQATTDHSLVQEMLEQGYLSEIEMKGHPQRHIITRAVGTYAKVKVDTLIYDLKEVEYLLLCSDGLTSMLTDKEIYEIIKHNKEIQQLPERLIDEANQKGGLDNIAVIIAKKQEVNQTC